MSKLLTLGVSLLVSLSVPFSVLATTVPAIADNCADVLILGLRGDGDSMAANHGMGADSEAVGFKIQALLANTYTATLEGVPYDANLKNAFYDQETGGEKQLKQRIKTRHAECPHASIVVIGQSLGAAVAHQSVYAIIPPVSAVILLGDPQHHPNAPYNRSPDSTSGTGIYPTGPTHDVPPGDYPRVASYCLEGDAVCGNSKLGAFGGINNRQHEQYREDKDGVATTAANFAISWVQRDRRGRCKGCS